MLFRIAQFILSSYFQKPGSALKNMVGISMHCKYNDCTQYSFWQCYVSNCNLAVLRAANGCAQSMTVMKLKYKFKK